MQVPNGTGPGVRRSKRPLLASRTRCNVLWKPPKFGNKVKIGIKVQFGNKFANWCNVLSIEGVIVYGHVPECNVTFGRGRLHNVWWDPHIDHKIQQHLNKSGIWIILLTPEENIHTLNIVASFRGMHASPTKHSYAWLPIKCDYRTNRQTDTLTGTDRKTPDKVIHMCRYASGDTKIYLLIHPPPPGWNKPGI